METLSSRIGNMQDPTSSTMSRDISSDSRRSLRHKAKDAALALRCECGTRISASDQQQLVERARLHFEAFHPDLGAEIPMDAILAMAEQKGDTEK